MNLRMVLILGALSAFGPLAIDFYLPAFPAMAQAFATDEKHVQATLAAYFLGLSIGQLAYGPVADRFGRRKPLMFGVTLFTLASLGCAYAPNLDTLVVARFVQALGGCAGMVLSRAIVSDKCDPVASAKVFSQLMLVMGLAPILAPMLGGVLVNLAGWQSIFLALSLFSAGCLLAVSLGLPESLPAHIPRQPLSGALRQYVRLLGDRVFLGHALTGDRHCRHVCLHCRFAIRVHQALWRTGRTLRLAIRHQCCRLHTRGAGECPIAGQARTCFPAGARRVAVPDCGPGAVGRGGFAPRAAVAAAGAVVHLHCQPGLHHPQCIGVCHERAGRAGRQRFGIDGVRAVQRCCGCRCAGRATARWQRRTYGAGDQLLRGIGGQCRAADPALAGQASRMSG